MSFQEMPFWYLVGGAVCHWNGGPKYLVGKGNKGEGRIKATRAESQWIVAARPLCHLQYPVAYLSRLQRILPAVQWKLRFKASRKADPPHEGHPRHVPPGAEAPYRWSASERRAHAVASSPDSDLEAFES
ncbi:unnamed protein product [Sphenostylis stenocarpa]|uniref:Uncharacterized protein n=1 Tax=Sphenostylis stenocarpa TaxID=92480 RepID=A0AA86W4Q2_9FABA|nr:unnamed protein product [Sphenostylis stenocarpa]